MLSRKTRGNFGLGVLSRRGRVDRQRVYAARKFVCQRSVDHAVAFETALPAEGFRHDIEPEVALAARPMAGVTFMPMRFVFDAQAFGRESLAQPFGDEIGRSHRFADLADQRRRGQ